MDQRGRFEVSVSGLLLLGGAALVTTGLVFLLGVYVGKGIAEKRYLGRQEVVRVPVEPETGGSEVRETFWDRLDREGEATPAKPAEAKDTPTPEPAIRITAPRAPSTPSRGEPTPEPTREPTREARIEREPTPAPATSAGRYQVQVTALADREAAFSLVRELRREGHDARVVEGSVDGRELYRVRVGRYPDREAAARAAEALEREGYSEAYPVAE